MAQTETGHTNINKATLQWYINFRKPVHKCTARAKVKSSAPASSGARCRNAKIQLPEPVRVIRGFACTCMHVLRFWFSICTHSIRKIVRNFTSIKITYYSVRNVRIPYLLHAYGQYVHHCTYNTYLYLSLYVSRYKILPKKLCISVRLMRTRVIHSCTDNM